MRFALLGSDPDALTIARAVADSAAHDLVWLGELDHAASMEFARGIPVSDEWESLLLGTKADAVIVARGADDLRAEQLRKLVQEKVPLLLSHPSHPSMLICYELDMIRRESGGLLFPALLARFHPLVVRLVEQLDSHLQAAAPAKAGTPALLGALEQLVIERQLSDRSRESVLPNFGRDIDLARLFCGELTKVGAMAPADGDARYANLGVQLSGPKNVLVRWSVGPVEEAEGARLTLFAGGGKAKLWMPDDGPWKLEISPTDGATIHQEASADLGGLAVAEFIDATSGRSDNGNVIAPPNWIDACRSVELTEAIDRSLIKGRTVELYFEDYTEQGTFKGTMTSLGCGLLFFALALLVFGVVARQFGFPIAGYLTYFMLAALTVFLSLQLLRLVFSKNNSFNRDPQETAEKA